MAIYSVDNSQYRDRVLRRGRPPDQTFQPDESLYRRVREEDLVKDMVTALNISPFAEGASVNRAKYSEPSDVLEPDCCHGHLRLGYAVVEFKVEEVPPELECETTHRIFQFRLKHDPLQCCFPHSVICCNEVCNPPKANQEPPRLLRNRFRAKLAGVILNGDRIRRFRPVADVNVATEK